MMATIFTREKLTQQTIAKEILNGMVENEFMPDKMGLFEPLRQPFTKEGFLDLWRLEKPGCYEEEVGMTGTAGGCMIKSKKPNLLLSTSWWDCPNQEAVNHITLFFTKATFIKNQQQIENLFRHIIQAANGFYGHITADTAMYRQGSGRMLIQKLPGIYWCNYFGQQVIERLGKEKIAAVDWYKAEVDEKEGLYSYIADTLYGDWVEDDIHEMRLKWQLGIKSFEEAKELEVFMPEE